MTTDRITIATDMARERIAEAGLGSCQPTCAVEHSDGSVRMIAALTVSAADIDAQIDLLRDRGVARKPEDARPVSCERLTDDEIDGIAQNGVGLFEDCLTGGEVTTMAREIRDSRAAIARVEALIERLRRISTAIGVKYADDFEAALRGERSVK